MNAGSDDPREQPPLVEIPHRELSPEALRGVIEAFVLREGTDYGDSEVPHETKIAQVQRQLERREARILFDTVSESLDIVPTTRPGARRA